MPEPSTKVLGTIILYRRSGSSVVLRAHTEMTTTGPEVTFPVVGNAPVVSATALTPKEGCLSEATEDESVSENNTTHTAEVYLPVRTPVLEDTDGDSILMRRRDYPDIYFVFT